MQLVSLPQGGDKGAISVNLAGLAGLKSGLCRATEDLLLITILAQQSQKLVILFCFFDSLGPWFCFLTDSGSGAGQTSGGEGPVGSGVLVWVVSGCTLLLVVIIILAVVLWRYHRRRCVPESGQSAPISLNTLAAPKRDSFSSDNNGSDRSDVVFPLRASDSMICRHYERVSCDYGPPVYIVQEIAPQNPTNVYYKV